MADRIALAMITRDLPDPAPVLRFLDNAKKYGHTIERVVIAHLSKLDSKLLQSIRQVVKLDTVQAQCDETLRDQLRTVGMDKNSIEKLVINPCPRSSALAPYGLYRTAVMIKALLTGLDYLLFFDDDIHPKVLVSLDQGRPAWEEIDFVGRHLARLSDPDVVATTSDYSGYYIVPPMAFPGLNDLLTGVGKDRAIEYLENCESHECVFLGSHRPKYTFATNKLLGGNLGLDLGNPSALNPFFSTTFEFNSECYLGRGEDTLLGHAISRSGKTAIDIDLRVFHDTFGNFPKRPRLDDEAVRSRFFLACMGWIGRNPFLSWYKNKHELSEVPFEEIMSRQRRGLQKGGKLAAEHLGDPRFEQLADAFETSLTSLPDVIGRYQRMFEGWQSLVETLGKQPISESDNLDDQLAIAS